MTGITDKLKKNSDLNDKPERTVAELKRPKKKILLTGSESM